MLKLAPLLALCLLAVPAQAGWRDRAYQDDWRNDRTYSTWAWACDRVTRKCVYAQRYFRNPVWR